MGRLFVHAPGSRPGAEQPYLPVLCRCACRLALCVHACWRLLLQQQGSTVAVCMSLFWRPVLTTRQNLSGTDVGVT